MSYRDQYDDEEPDPSPWESRPLLEVHPLGSPRLVAHDTGRHDVEVQLANGTVMKWDNVLFEKIDDNTTHYHSDDGVLIEYKLNGSITLSRDAPSKMVKP